jgi:copper(I)-binding protein
MSFKPTFLMALSVVTFCGPAVAQMTIEDAYARASSPIAQTGAAFVAITNHSDVDDRLISVISTAAQRVEIHTHLETDAGVMQMIKLEDGLVIPAGETYVLLRGADHVMLLGLTGPLLHGEGFEATFAFEHADPVTLIIPVDLERQPGDGALLDTGHQDMDHQDMDHQDMDHQDMDHQDMDHDGSMTHGTDG